MQKRLGYFLRFECEMDNRFSHDIGPFEDFFQLTYHDLRVGPNGAFIAQHCNGWWYVWKEFGDMNEKWSDVVMWARELNEGETFLPTEA